MFYETVYTDTGLGDALNPGGIPVWQQLKFDNKALWKQAGKPTTGATFTPPPGLPTMGPGGASGADGATGASGGIGDMLGSIPPTYLMIGAAIVLLMVLKK